MIFTVLMPESAPIDEISLQRYVQAAPENSELLLDVR